MFSRILASSVKPRRYSTLKKSIRSASTFDVNYDDNRVKHKYFPKDRTVSIIGVPLNLGQPLTGVERGPSDIRESNIVQRITEEGWNVVDHGDIDCSTTPDAASEHKVQQTGERKFKCADSIAEVTRRTAEKVATLASKDEFILSLGGDHSIAIGTIAGILKARPETAVVWVDAHADINTPFTSGSGNIHGMPVSLLLKHPECLPLGPFSWLNDIPNLQPHRIAYIGLRDLDRGERRIIKELGIKAFTMQDVDKHGIGKIMEMVIDHFRNGEIDRPIHLSFDIDGIDPIFAPATGTTVRGGLTSREGFYICEALAETGLLSSMDIVEVNSSLATNEADAQATVNMAARLVGSALGNRLL